MKKILLLITINILISPIIYFNIDNVSAASNTYYVANAGSDSNNGLSESTPWRTIGKVNTAMNGGVIGIGNDILFKRGDIFSDTYLNIKTGGSSNDRMIIGSYGSGNRPVFNNTGEYSILLYTNDIGYITIQDLILKNSTGDSLFVGAKLTDIVISRVNVADSGHNGIFVDDTIGLKIENCVVHDCATTNICLYGSPSHRLSNTQVLNCTVYGGAIDDNIQLHLDDDGNDAGSNHLFRNCTSYDSGEDGFDITAGNNIIVEDCETYSNDHCGLMHGHGARNLTIQNCYFHDEVYGMYFGTGDNLIIRNNVVYDTTNAIFVFYPTSDKLEFCTVYNNDIVQPSGCTYANRLMQIEFDYYKYFTLKNNIFVTLDSTNPTRLLQVLPSGSIPPDDNVTFDTNLWYHGSGSSTNKWYNGSANMNLAGWNAYYPTDDFDNPDLIDPANNDFRLQSDSPCIDNGAWLTQTNGAGSGSTITVDDASYFTDGYGIISGDIVFIGDDANLKIIDINYNNNQITINRSITWTDSESVSLSVYSGSKPDIGAYEFVENEQGPIISNIMLMTSNPLDTDPLYGWINITCKVIDDIAVQQVKLNITEPDGSFNNVSMNVCGTNSYYFNSNTIFSYCGDYYYNIWVKDANQNTKLSDDYTFSMAPNWDINKDKECNILDFSLISNNYNKTGQNGWIREDVDNNGEVKVLDLVIISTHYEEEW